MFEEIRDRVLRANLALAEHGLVTLTWGNVSEIDRNEGIIAIKPSGVKYEAMRAEDIVILDPYGKKIDGDMNPSSDTPTHVELYKSFPSVGGGGAYTFQVGNGFCPVCNADTAARNDPRRYFFRRNSLHKEINGGGNILGLREGNRQSDSGAFYRRNGTANPCGARLLARTFLLGRQCSKGGGKCRNSGKYGNDGVAYPYDEKRS